MKKHWLAGLAAVLYATCILTAAVPARAEPATAAAQQPPAASAPENTSKKGEAAGESDEEQFKHSAQVQWLAHATGMSIEQAYWLCVLLNFGAIAALIVWASKKNLPGIFRARTASIQKAMEEARKASEEANRRLAEIEQRLSRLGAEISTMSAAAEQEAAAEEGRIKAAAEEEARKIVDSAEQEIAAAAKAARRDLTAYAADLAVALAKKQVQVDAGTDRALVRDFVQQLGTGTNGGRKGAA